MMPVEKLTAARKTTRCRSRGVIISRGQQPTSILRRRDEMQVARQRKRRRGRAEPLPKITTSRQGLGNLQHAFAQRASTHGWQFSHPSRDGSVKPCSAHSLDKGPQDNAWHCTAPVAKRSLRAGSRSDIAAVAFSNLQSSQLLRPHT